MDGLINFIFVRTRSLQVFVGIRNSKDIRKSDNIEILLYIQFDVSADCKQYWVTAGMLIF